MPPIQIIPPRPTGLTTPTATAALGASRALTSHVRNFYLVCYQGRCRRPRLTFFVDMSLLVLALVSAIAAIYFVRLPVSPPGVTATFAVPPVRSAAAVPLAFTIRSTEGKTHQNVRLQWRLPQGAQLIESLPALTSDGGAFLGEVKPGRDVTSHALVRFFLPPGDNADFGFSVLYDDNGIEHQYTATDQRPVVGTALTAEIPSEFHDADITKNGTTLPLRIVNDTDVALPSVYVTYAIDRATSTEAHQELGDLAPHEERLLYIAVHPSGDTMHLQWTAGAASRDLTTGSWDASVVDASDRLFPTVQGPLRARPGKAITLSVTNAFAGDSLLVVHPLLTPSVRKISLDVGASQPELPAPSNATGTNHEWFVVPVMTSSVNRPILGTAVMGATAVTLPFSAQIRYVSSAGDQLGAGPNPPQVGIETRYWVFWTVGPVDNALKNITVDADLPPGVRPTGNASAADGGSFNITSHHVRWTLPQLNPSDSAETAPTAIFGFEISATPAASNIGQPIQLLGTSTATADDMQTSLTFEGADDSKTSVLPEDAGKENAGMVLPQP